MDSDAFAEILDKADISLGRYGRGKHRNEAPYTTSFPDFDLWVTLSGSYLLSINSREYLSKPGDAYLMTPGTTLTLKAFEDSEQLYCHFTPQYAGSFGFQGDFSDYRIPDSHRDILNALSRYLPELIAAHSVPARIAVKSILKILLSEMLLSDPQNRDTFLSSSIMANLDHLSNTMKFIHENMNLNISIKDLSAITGFNESYFSRYFKRHIGISPKQYILKVKINFAKHLLTDKGLSVKETALLVGFSDQFIFSKKFKSICGVSPSSYKNMII